MINREGQSGVITVNITWVKMVTGFVLAALPLALMVAGLIKQWTMISETSDKLLVAVNDIQISQKADHDRIVILETKVLQQDAQQARLQGTLDSVTNSLNNIQRSLGVIEGQLTSVTERKSP